MGKSWLQENAMPLAEYARKRKFAATPEPGPVVAEHAGWRFVVQKHKARQLHYDFRLEMDGVLKSWAVPKGPTPDPAEKRLAMEVEDHPVEYIGFEGRIPEGNYGAGTVMVWDAGTWEPAGTAGMTEAQREAQARAMLAKGDLKFVLHGTKLHGEWVLAKMHSRRPGSKGTEWLLIKHHDAAAESGYQIEQHDGSVLSGRSMEEIAADKRSAEWVSNKPQAGEAERGNAAPLLPAAGARGNAAPLLPAAGARGNAASLPPAAGARGNAASLPPAAGARDWSELLEGVKGVRKGAMPKTVIPMLATLVEGPPKARDWLYEIKWDGYRALAYVEDGRAKLVSRNQNDLTAAFAEVAAELPLHVRARRVLLDGEVVALDERGRSSFSLMQQRTGIGRNGRKHGLRLELAHAETGNAASPLPAAGAMEIPIAYYAFDLLHVEQWSLMGVALDERKRLLREALATNATVRYSEHFDDGAKLLEAAREQGLEGIVAKRRDSKYEQKRSRAWCKVKLTKTEECVIGGWTEPKGSREYFGSLVLGLYDKRGRLISVGQAGTGFTRETEAEIFALLKKLETTKNPFANNVETARGIHYVRPELVAEIKFTEWTHEGLKGGVKMRAPVFLGLRADKTAKECKAA
jgi:bifunctional non-homologous end joining protein LigD